MMPKIEDDNRAAVKLLGINQDGNKKHKRDTTQLVSDGRISIGKASEMLDLSIYDIHRIAEKHGIELGASAAQVKKKQRKRKENVNSRAVTPIR